jgi:hypothetical protein
MRVARLVLSFLLILSSSPRLNSQQTTSAPQRDPQALAALGQVAAAIGWTTGTVPPTIVASGTLTRPGAGQQAPASFVIKQRGPSQHRMDLQDSGTISTTVVNGLAGKVLSSAGTKYRLPAHAAFSIQSPAFPFLSDLMHATDPSIEIQNLGTNTIDGTTCQGVGIVRHAKSDDKLAHFRDLAAPLKVWISLQTFLPVRIDFIRLADDNPYVVMNFSRSYSDYRVVNGIAVAFQQDERFEGQLMYQIQFTSVQFNAAVADADFDPSKL